MRITVYICLSQILCLAFLISAVKPKTDLPLSLGDHGIIDLTYQKKAREGLHDCAVVRKQWCVK